MNDPELRSASRGVFLETVRRDLTIAYRNASDLLNPLAFFVIVVTLFPLGISPSAQILAEIAPGVLWVAALLATLLSVALAQPMSRHHSFYPWIPAPRQRLPVRRWMSMSAS